MRKLKHPSTAAAIAAAASLLVLAHPSAAQEPTILTAFSVEGTRFAETLTDGERSAVEDSMARHIASMGREFYPYLNWIPASMSTARNSELPSLRIGLRQDSIRPQAGRPACLEILLTLEGDAKDPDVPTAGVFDEVELYPICELLPSTSDGLLHDLTRVLTELFQSEAFRRDQLQDALLSRIVVADGSLIDVEDGVGQIVVRLPWRRMRPDPGGTTLRLNLVGGVFTRMDLQEPGPSADDFIIWHPVQLLVADNVITSAMVSRFKELLETDPEPRMKAFLSKYEQGRPTGLVEEPDI